MTDQFRAMCAELTERLEWFIAEDETNENDPGNQYWLTGKQAGIDSVTRARALQDQPVAQPPADGEVAELVETLKGIAYWRRHGTIGGLAPAPFDIRQADRLDRAAELLQRLASDNAGLEAAAESAYLDNLSLLDSQND